MSINRRNFFKVLGVTGATLAVEKKVQGSTNSNEDVEFYGILYDSTRCVGCQTCEFSCAEANNLPEPEDYPEIGVIRKTNESRRTVVNAFDTSKGEVYVKRQCMHCNSPACASACLTQAMHKTNEGPVIWRGDKCMGCRYCMVSCPFDVPKFEYQSPNPKITKCDMCFSRQQEEKVPACVENCPAEALMFGTRRELLQEAHKRIAENPDLYVNHIYGENEAGGTSFLYLSPVPFEELGFNTSLQQDSYPALSKGFLYSVPSIFVLWPIMLLGIHKATKNNSPKNDEDE
ncbi:MAG: 4Fe-4S dicluster domain-containing protein [Prolixibacteraceae bacterium]|nr:4Fe-4S dicluster domain-containing protein [Prolixibacteraceae bacterium]